MNDGAVSGGDECFDGGWWHGAGFVVQFFPNQCDDVMPLVLLANLNQIFVLI